MHLAPRRLHATAAVVWWGADASWLLLLLLVPLDSLARTQRVAITAAHDGTKCTKPRRTPYTNQPSLARAYTKNARAHTRRYSVDASVHRLVSCCARRRRRRGRRQTTTNTTSPTSKPNKNKRPLTPTNLTNQPAKENRATITPPNPTRKHL